MNHLGRRVSDLLDGQLTPAETEAAWAHVHTCPPCRDDVEREGWVKTRLSTLSWDDGPRGCSDHLKGALLGLPPEECLLGVERPAPYDVGNRRPRLARVGMAAIGGGAAGAAVMGVLALGPAPADLPSPDRRQPVSHQNQPRPVGQPVPVRVGP